MTRLLEWLPRGNTLDDAAWHRRHRLLQVVLALHVPLLLGLGFALRVPPGLLLGAAVAPVLVLLAGGHFVRHKRTAATLISAGLVWCSISLVGITGGTIEAHFHFFIIIGFIALYQDWVPFLWNVLFTAVSHGVGTIFWPTLIFNHVAAQQNPWFWSGVHALGVLLACVGMVIFWRITEDEQTEKEQLGQDLVRADAEIGRKQFTSDMLVNLARRNQSMLYRQLDIINQLEEKEQDPDQLAELFKLDHLATRVRRNAESLLVLSGEQPPRVWSAPVSMRDVVRAAIAETEDLDRVEFSVDDRVAVSGHSVADLTHLLAELTENAVRFSPPDTSVTIRSRPHRAEGGGQVLTIEDWGVGMPADELAAANELLISPREVDLAISQRLGFHVVARLAARHAIEVSLSTTPGSGLTAVVILPAALFVADPQAGPHAGIGTGPEQTRRATAVHEQRLEHGRDLSPAGRTSVATAERAELPGLVAAQAWTPPAPQPPAPHAPIAHLPTAHIPTAHIPTAQIPVAQPPVIQNPGSQPPAPPAAAPPGGFGAGGPGPSGPIPGRDSGWTGWWDPSPADRPGPGSPWPGGLPQRPNGNGHGGHNGNGHNGNGNSAGHNGNGHNGNGHNGHANGANGADGNGHRPNGHTPARPDTPADGAAPEAHGPGSHPNGTPGWANGTPPAASADGAPAGANTPDTPAADTRVAAAIPAPRPAGGDDAGSDRPSTGASGLRRRVPQASLAPELRNSGGAAESPAPAAPPAPSPGSPAVQALSRYQASRQAAQALADQEQRRDTDSTDTDRRAHP